MADISQITLPSNETYNFKDVWARRNKLDANAGSENSGKVLGVSSTGEVHPTSYVLQIQDGSLVDDGSGVILKETEVPTIDDTAGAGDTDKVWSADKVTQELEKKAAIIVSSASGAVASFPDGAEDLPVRDLSVGIEPVQDLHGYDSPWPAGGGKNKLPKTYATNTINGVTFTVYDDGSINVNGTASARVDYYLSGSSSGGNLDLPTGNYTLSYGNASLSTNGLYMQMQKAGATVTIDGNMTFDANELGFIRLIITNVGAVINNVKIYPMIRLASVSDATFAPYSNICPITGWTGAKVWDDPKYGGTIRWNQLMPNPADWVLQNSSGGVTITKDDTGATLVAGSSINPYNPAIKGTAYGNFFTGAIIDHKYLICAEWRTPDNISGVKPSLYIQGSGTGTLTVPGTSETGWNSCAKIRTGARANYSVVSYFGVQNATAVLNQGDRFQIRNINVIDLTQMFGQDVADAVYAAEQANAGDGVAWFRGLFPDEYYPYNAGEDTCVSAVNGDPYRYVEISFPSDGGTLDLTTGVLTVDRASVDLGTLNWYMSATGEFNVNKPSDCKPGASADVGNIICTDYKTSTRNGQPDFSIALSPSYLFVKDSKYPDAATFKTAMSGVQLVYELATPITYQLTPQELRTMLGQNNIWADTGDTAVTYPADTKLYIDNKIAQAIAAL